jgi:hypothetical protein
VAGVNLKRTVCFFVQLEKILMKDFLKLLTNHVLVNTIVSFSNYDVIVKSNQFFPEKKVLMFSTTILADKTVGFSTSFTLDCEKDIISFFFNGEMYCIELDNQFGTTVLSLIEEKRKAYLLSKIEELSIEEIDSLIERL